MAIISQNYKDFPFILYFMKHNRFSVPNKCLYDHNEENKHTCNRPNSDQVNITLNLLLKLGTRRPIIKLILSTRPSIKES